MYIKLVKEFHETYGVAVEANPTIPSKEICKLRIELIREELNESEEALGHGDLAHIAKELADLQYVLSGTILALGLQDKFPAIFQEVHRSNMSKVCNNEQTARSLTNGLGAIKEVESGFIAYNASGKVLKPKSYSPADIESILG